MRECIKERFSCERGVLKDRGLEEEPGFSQRFSGELMRPKYFLKN